MDVDSLYKQLKQESQDLDIREKELTKKLEDVKRLTKQNADRQTRIAALEMQLSKMMGSS